MNSRTRFGPIEIPLRSILLVEASDDSTTAWVKNLAIREATRGRRVVWVSLRESADALQPLAEKGVTIVDIGRIDEATFFQLIRLKGKTDRILFVDGLDLVRDKGQIDPDLAVETAVGILMNQAKRYPFTAVATYQQEPALDTI